MSIVEPFNLDPQTSSTQKTNDSTLDVSDNTVDAVIDSQEKVVSDLTESGLNHFFDFSLQDAFDFIAKIADAWPLAFLLALLLLRNPITSLLERISKFKGHGIEVDFSQILDKIESKNTFNNNIIERDVEQKIDFKDQAEFHVKPNQSKNYGTSSSHREIAIKLADVSPRSAVLESYVHLDSAILDLCAACDIKDVSFKTRVTRLLNVELLTNRQCDILIELNRLRNSLAHHRENNVSYDDAVRYSNLAFSMVNEVNSIIESRKFNWVAIYKGGPNDGFIVLNDTRVRMTMNRYLELNESKGKMVQGLPIIGRKTYGIDLRVKDFYSSNLPEEKKLSIIEMSGHNIKEVFNNCLYIIDSIDEEEKLVYLKHVENSKGE